MKLLRKIALATVLVAILVSCASSSWTTNPYSVVPKDNYVAAVGYGMTMETAEQNAKVELASLFGSGINSVVSRVMTESEVERNGITSESSSDKFFQASSVTINVDNLYGVEIIKRMEKDGRFFALAAMNKATTFDWYKSQLESLKKSYEKLLSSTNSDGTLSSLEKAVLLAKTVEEHNRDAAICSYLSGEEGEYLDASVSREILRNAKSSIIFAISWLGEEEPSVTSSVSKVFSSLGLKVGNDNESSTAKVEIILDWTESKGTGVASSFVFAEYDVSVSLVDMTDGGSIFVFTSKGREGHQTIEGAKSRALTALSEDISKGLGNELKEQFAL